MCIAAWSFPRINSCNLSHKELLINLIWTFTTRYIGRAFRRKAACFSGAQAVCFQIITLEDTLLYYRQSKCVWHFLYMKVLVIQLDGHHASQTHLSSCQHLTLFLRWPTWKIFLQTAVQIVGRQQVVLNPLATAHKGLWISSFICKINKNRVFIRFTFMICFMFSICRNSSGPPSFIAKKKTFSSLNFSIWWKEKLRSKSCRQNLILFPSCLFFFLKVHQQILKDGPSESCNKSSSMHIVNVMKTCMSQNCSAVLLCKAPSFPIGWK